MFFHKKEKLTMEMLRTAFESQKKTLLANDYPAILNMSAEDFENQLELLWKKVTQMEIAVKGNVPLLLVVEQGDALKKMKKINGHTELNFDTMEKSPEPQTSPFSLLLDVEDGRNMIAKSPKDALKKFEKDKRHALTIDQSISLLTYFPALLKNHYLISAGSFYTTKDDESLPLLWLLDEHGNPELHYAWFHIAHGSYGTASYAIKIQ